MDETQIRKYFAPNWVFRLFEVIPFLVAVIGIPLLIFLLGGIVAAILGVWDAFRCNILAYPVGVSVALAAYGWFAWAFPKFLARLYPAFETSPDGVGHIIETWANRLANNPLAIGSASLFVALLNLQNLDSLWTSPQWIGDVWAKSDQHVMFFKWYFALNDVVLGGFLLGSGAIGVLGTVLLFHSLMKLPVKLSHYRSLEAVGELSTGLTVWTLLGFALIGPSAGLSAPNILCEPNAPISFRISESLNNPLVTLLSIISVIAALSLPVYFAHSAIVQAKAKQIAALFGPQDATYRLADDLANKLNHLDLSTPETAKIYARELDELRQAYERIDAINKSISEIQSIPEWPITWKSILQVGSAALGALWTNVLASRLAEFANFLGNLRNLGR